MTFTFRNPASLPMNKLIDHKCINENPIIKCTYLHQCVNISVCLNLHTFTIMYENFNPLDK